jgi:hypothetical protein
VVAILAVSVVAAASALVLPAVSVVEESVLLHAFSARRPAPSRGRSKRFITGN